MTWPFSLLSAATAMGLAGVDGVDGVDRRGGALRLESFASETSA